MWGRQLLLKGLGWRIGSGHSCNIWNANWLPGTSHFKLYTHKPSLEVPQKVADLIKHSNGLKSWNDQLLSSSFLPIDVDRIKQITLPQCDSPDILAWLHHWDDLYSVRRGYQFAKALQICEKSSSESSNNQPDSLFWRKLWSCPIAPKIILWTWQAVQDRLPTNQNLFNRGVLPFSHCLPCSDASESLIHILYECELTREFWSIATPKQPPIIPQESVLHLLLQQGLVFFKFHICCCWFLWHARNLSFANTAFSHKKPAPLSASFTDMPPMLVITDGGFTSSVAPLEV